PPADDGPPAVGKVGEGLIPRATIFGNPERTGGQLSPDGKWLGFSAPREGVLNVWVAPGKAGQADVGAARALTTDTKRPVHQWGFASDNVHIVYRQDTGGDEDFHLYSVEIATGKTVDLTPLPKVAARVEASDPSQPGVIIAGLNDRDPRFHDLYKI